MAARGLVWKLPSVRSQVSLLQPATFQVPSLLPPPATGRVRVGPVKLRRLQDVYQLFSTSCRANRTAAGVPRKLCKCAPANCVGR